VTITFAVKALMCKLALIGATAVADVLPLIGCGVPTIVCVAQVARLIASIVAATTSNTSTTLLTGSTTLVGQCCISTERILMISTNIVLELGY
jgi:hypothetical protein